MHVNPEEKVLVRDAPELMLRPLNHIGEWSECDREDWGVLTLKSLLRLQHSKSLKRVLPDYFILKTFMDDHISWDH